MENNLDSLLSVYTIFVNNNKGLQRVPVSKGSLKAVLDEFNEVFVEETGLCKGVRARIT